MMGAMGSPIRRSATVVSVAVVLAALPGLLVASSQPIRAQQAMVVSQDAIASAVGVQVMRDGGNAIDATVATAFALAVTLSLIHI